MPAQPPVARIGGNFFAQGKPYAFAQLGGGGVCEGDDEHPRDVGGLVRRIIRGRFRRGQAADDAFGEYGGFTRTRAGRNENIVCLTGNRFKLLRCPYALCHKTSSPCLTEGTEIRAGRYALPAAPPRLWVILYVYNYTFLPYICQHVLTVWACNDIIPLKCRNKKYTKRRGMAVVFHPGASPSFLNT